MANPHIIAREMEECRFRIREAVSDFRRLLNQHAQPMTVERARAYCIGHILQATGDDNYPSEMYSMREIIQEFEEGGE